MTTDTLFLNPRPSFVSLTETKSHAEYTAFTAAINPQAVTMLNDYLDDHTDRCPIEALADIAGLKLPFLGADIVADDYNLFAVTFTYYTGRKDVHPADEKVTELIPGHVYWLGATWGKFVVDPNGNYFNLGNCFCYQSETEFANTPVHQEEESAPAPRSGRKTKYEYPADATPAQKKLIRRRARKGIITN